MVNRAAWKRNRRIHRNSYQSLYSNRVPPDLGQRGRKYIRRNISFFPPSFSITNKFNPWTLDEGSPQSWSIRNGEKASAFQPPNYHRNPPSSLFTTRSKSRARNGKYIFSLCIIEQILLPFDLLRASLYNSFHPILVIKINRASLGSRDATSPPLVFPLEEIDRCFASRYKLPFLLSFLIAFASLQKIYIYTLAAH